MCPTSSLLAHPASSYTMLTALLCAQALSLVAAAPNPLLQPRDLESIINQIGDLPDKVGTGILDAFKDLPDAQYVKDKLRNDYGIGDDKMEQVPISIMNIPGYANWTSQGWNLRVHGQAYKDPPLTEEQRDDATDFFVPGLDMKDLNATEKEMAHNVSGSILRLPVENIAIPFKLDLNGSIISDFKFPLPTDSRGEFDQFIILEKSAQDKLAKGMGKGNGVWKLDLHSNDTQTGNATAYFVPEQGTTVVSDIDDILRVTQIYSPFDGLRNSFVKPYVGWMNMPDVYNKWASKDADIHFHYLTTLPQMVTRAYESYIYSEYPMGSFDTRPLNFTTVDQTLKVRMVALRKIFETYHQRKFVVVGDTSNGDIMRDYPALATAFPNQLSCLLIRNTSATDDKNNFPYNTKGFKDVDPSKYMFFSVPDDIAGLNLPAGDCVNKTIQQNITFDMQGLPSILDSAAVGRQTGSLVSWMSVWMVVLGMLFIAA